MEKIRDRKALVYCDGFARYSQVEFQVENSGHRDFVHNMIYVTAESDVAVLVVSAQMGAFEAGISQIRCENSWKIRQP